MKYSEQVRSDARATADYIREHGIVQGRDGITGRACCAYRSMSIVTNGETRALKAAFLEITKTETVMAFNDAKGRTKEEVLAVFERIANS